MVHHLFRAYVLGFICVILLAIIIIEQKGGFIATLLGSAMFFSNFSFSENIIRLGTNEPYQILFLALFSILYLKKDEIIQNSIQFKKVINYLLIALLSWTLFIKESGFAIFPTLLFTEAVKYKYDLRKYSKQLIIVPIIIFIVGILFSKGFDSNTLSSFPDYTSNYILNLKGLYLNTISIGTSLLNLTSPFLKVAVLLMPILLLDRFFLKRLRESRFQYWIFFTIFFALILIPWTYTLERYQLMTIFGISIITPIIIESFFKLFINKANKLIDTKLILLGFQLGGLVVIVNLYFRGFPINYARTVNYSKWFAEFTQFESDQVKGVMKYSDKTHHINGTEHLNNLEILYGIPLQQEHLYNLSLDTKRLESSELPDNGYIFSRTSFEPVISFAELDQNNLAIVESKEYYVKQINPIEFRKAFIFKPLTTLTDPPLQPEGLYYYWDVREIN